MILIIVLTCFLFFSKSIASPNAIYANPNAFKMTVDTRYPGETGTGRFKIQVDQVYNFNYNVDCNGDGIFEFYSRNAHTICTYPSPGIYQVWITGYLILRYNYAGADVGKIISIDQWGNIPWSDFGNSFSGAINLRRINATDTPNLFNVNRYTDGGISTMFGFAPLTYVHPSINLWNTSNVRNMQSTFFYAIDFNQDIGNWNTSNVVNMLGMFINARSFNKYIGNWNTSNVRRMDMMFKGATSFNQDISRWNTGKVINMEEMFMDAVSFNQNIGNWNTSMVTNMAGMFRNARAFNQNIGNWNVSNVTKMENMLDYSGLSIQNYDLTLIGWASRPVRPNVTLGAMGLKFCNGRNARSILTSPPNNWKIIGDTEECPCVNTPPDQAILNYPINDVTVYSSNLNILYNVNNGWGVNCIGNYNYHNVYISQNCTGNYINLGPTNAFYNLLPNLRYCWFVIKSNGAINSQSQVQVFSTSDNLVNNVSVISTNRCVNGYIGMLINPIVNNPVRWKISGSIPDKSTLEYVTFVMIPTKNERNDFIEKMSGISKATTVNNARSVAIDIYRNSVRMYVSGSSNSTPTISNNMAQSVSPFNNYIVENVEFITNSNSYSVDFSIKFLNNFKSDTYSIYSTAVFKDIAGGLYSTNSFKNLTRDMVLTRFNQNRGDGIWEVDMNPPRIITEISRSGANGEIIKFDPLTYNNSYDSESGINNNFKYFSIRSIGNNSGEWKILNSNSNINISTNNHINYSSIQEYINPIGLQSINSGTQYEIVDTNVNYQARIGALDNACNFGYIDININSQNPGWLVTLGGNVYINRGVVNINIPNNALRIGE